MNYNEYEKLLLSFEKKLIKHTEDFHSKLNESQMMALTGNVKSTVDCYNFKSKFDEMMFLMESSFKLLDNINNFIILPTPTYNQFKVEDCQIHYDKGVKNLYIMVGKTRDLNIFNLDFKNNDKTDVRISYYWKNLRIKDVWGQRVNEKGGLSFPIILPDRGKSYFLNTLIEKELKSQIDRKNDYINKLNNAFILSSIFSEIKNSYYGKKENEKFMKSLLSDMSSSGFDTWDLSSNIKDKLESLKDFLLLTKDSNALTNSDFYNKMQKNNGVIYKNV